MGHPSALRRPEYPHILYVNVDIWAYKDMKDVFYGHKLIPCSDFVFIAHVILCSVQYNDGLLPDIILLTQCYFNRGTRLNVMKRFCICSL